MKKSLCILILTPTTLPEISGNAITAERWRQSLVHKGLHVHVLATGHLDANNFLNCLENVKPDVIHAHHVSRAGALILDPLIRERFARLPFVVSPAGTDLFSWEGQSYDRGAIVAQVCRRASIIITQGEWTAERLLKLFPDLQDRIIHVPKAFSWFGNDKFDLRETSGWTKKDFVFFYPAGIRPVKRNLEALLEIEKVHTIRSSCSYGVCRANPRSGIHGPVSRRSWNGSVHLPNGYLSYLMEPCAQPLNPLML